MSKTAEEVLARLRSFTEEQLPAVLPSLVEDIKGLSAEEKGKLIQAAFESRTPDPSTPTSWNQSRTLLGIVLHATGVQTIEGAAERAIRTQLQDEFAALNGKPEAFRSLVWISSDQLVETPARSATT